MRMVRPKRLVFFWGGGEFLVSRFQCRGFEGNGIETLASQGLDQARDQVSSQGRFVAVQTVGSDCSRLEADPLNGQRQSSM